MATAQQVIAYGMQEIGSPYVFGDEGPDSFDCSGLTQYVFGKAGITLPRTAAQQQDATQPVSASSARPGDLVFWGDPAHHVGLYLGGGRMLAAPHAGANVRVQDVYGSPEYRRVSALSGVAGAVDAVVTPVLNPVTDAAASLLGGLDSALRVGLVAAGGVALVAVGAWQATRGDRS